MAALAAACARLDPIVTSFTDRRNALMAATKSKRRKPTREQLKPGECLCDFCTGICCRYFSLPIDNPTTWDEYDTIRWYLAHGQTVDLRREGAVVPSGHDPLPVPEGRQPLRHLSQSPQDLPRIHDGQLRVRQRLVVREDLRDARADLGVRRGRAAASAKPRDATAITLPIVTISQ